MYHPPDFYRNIVFLSFMTSYPNKKPENANKPAGSNCATGTRQHIFARNWKKKHHQDKKSRVHVREPSRQPEQKLMSPWWHELFTETWPCGVAGNPRPSLPIRRIHEKRALVAQHVPVIFHQLRQQSFCTQRKNISKQNETVTFRFWNCMCPPLSSDWKKKLFSRLYNTQVNPQEKRPFLEWIVGLVSKWQSDEACWKT